MKRMFLLGLGLILFCSVASAETKTATTNTGGRDNFHQHTHDFTYEDIDTDTNTDTTVSRQGSEGGVGADVVVWQNPDRFSAIEEVVAEYRFDGVNDNHKIYAVVRLNLWDKVRSFFSSWR